MRVLLLGSFEVRGVEDLAVEIPGIRVRALLARLAMEAGRVVSADTLIDAIWEEQPPAKGANALQALVSRARRAIGAERVEGRAPGYRLVVDPVDVDLIRFERLAAAGRESGDLAMLREAESLWRGPALSDLQELRFAADAAVRLDEVRLAATEQRLGLEVAAGHDVLDEVRALAEAHPLAEPVQGLLIRALYAAGRHVAALDAYERVKERLVDELGVDPSPELAELHLAILRQEPRRPKRRTNLRAQVTSFVGREDDVAELTARVDTARLITIVGPGGAGKTRLAVEVAERASGAVWFVELAAVTDPAQVGSAVLTTIGVREVGLLEQPSGDPVDRLAEFFARQRAVLVLDNCEHLVEAVAQLVDRLLGACPELHILTTSRESLMVGGEHLHQIGPLPWAERTAQAPETFPAIRLFVERAKAVRPDFALSADNTADVVEICRRLDGLPLAIELAAARLRTFSVGQIAAKLDDRFTLLGRGSRTADARHRTLRAVIEWSWAPLTESERALAMWLAVFPAGATLDAMDDPDTLADLVDKSLVERNGERYRMLETIRSYALERLAESGSEQTVRAEHARYFLRLAEAAEAELRTANQSTALARLDAERDNLSAALRFAVDTADPDLGLRLVAALFWYWTLRGIHTERLRWTRTVLEIPGEAAVGLRPVRTVLAGLSSYESGSIEDGQLAVAAGIQLGTADSPGRTVLLVAPAFLENRSVAQRPDHSALSGWERGVTLLLSTAHIDQLAEARTEFEEAGDRFLLSVTLRLIAEHQLHHGDHQAAVAALTRATEVIEQFGSAGDAAAAGAELATALARLGELDRAHSTLTRAQQRADDAGEPHTVAYVGLACAELLMRQGDRRAALLELDRVDKGLAHTPFGARTRLWCTVFRGITAVLDDDVRAVRRLLGTADIDGVRPDDLAGLAQLSAALAVHIGAPTMAALLVGVAAALLGTEDRRGYDNLLAPADRARELLGADAFAAAFDSTAALTPTAAMEFLRSHALQEYSQK
ncbi:BTAD domain-containing putative transcriptional regulator [Nocardia iowensis]|uniref:AAA family ATPase n=1 Tax=Nocardia iowensis TaxID=204891 RepID=A0ABX8RKH4_NOCIO|nr:BTAD domain-containing putative transcriptional regulator [Nocardia iowensis]QXN90143.1 AAA family ATPase [Nocardia iowensis]